MFFIDSIIGIDINEKIDIAIYDREKPHLSAIIPNMYGPTEAPRKPIELYPPSIVPTMFEGVLSTTNSGSVVAAVLNMNPIIGRSSATYTG